MLQASRTTTESMVELLFHIQLRLTVFTPSLLPFLSLIFYIFFLMNMVPNKMIVQACLQAPPNMLTRIPGGCNA